MEGEVAVAGEAAPLHDDLGREGAAASLHRILCGNPFLGFVIGGFGGAILWRVGSVVAASRAIAFKLVAGIVYVHCGSPAKVVS
jgi:hypothetical protein